jgi:hypothetical protein
MSVLFLCAIPAGCLARELALRAYGDTWTTQEKLAKATPKVSKSKVMEPLDEDIQTKNEQQHLGVERSETVQGLDGLIRFSEIKETADW